MLAAPLLFACETVSAGSMSLTQKSLTDSNQKTMDAAFSAALTPLEDIGLRKREIPEQLQALIATPYIPPKMQCETLKHEIADIDALLGPDVDAPKAALTAQESYMETGGNLLQDAVVGLVKSQTDFIPFRSIVRRLTGANAHEKLVTQAVEAGKLRRAYLRGVSEAKFGAKCPIGPQLIAPTNEASAKPVKEQDLEIAKK